MSKFETLAEHFRAQIRSGALLPGERLPSISQQQQQFRVSQGTVWSAMLTLKAEGLIEGQQGQGVFVTSQQT